jgi:hypothetical protein
VQDWSWSLCLPPLLSFSALFQEQLVLHFGHDADAAVLLGRKVVHLGRCETPAVEPPHVVDRVSQAALLVGLGWPC